MPLTVFFVPFCSHFYKSVCNICPICAVSCPICSSVRCGFITSTNCLSLPTTLKRQISLPSSVLAESYFRRLFRIRISVRTKRKFTFSCSLSCSSLSKNAMSMSSSTNSCFFCSGSGSFVFQQQQTSGVLPFQYSVQKSLRSRPSSVSTSAAKYSWPGISLSLLLSEKETLQCRP